MPPSPSSSDLDPEILTARVAARLANRLELLECIDERLERIEAQLAVLGPLLEEAPNAIAVLGDIFDEYAEQVAERGVPLEQIVPELGRAFEATLRLLTSTHVRQLLDSDLLLPGAVAALGTAARAMAAAACAPESRLGLFGTLAALREPEVQRALGFVVDIARRFGTEPRAPLPGLAAAGES
ncbi:MAG: DUF1641 domain-containing protein [Enhygromyxa sp.]